VGQSPDVGIESGVGNLDPLPVRELPQALRQALGLRHLRAFDEGGNEVNAALQGCLNLDAYES
jgi:hypothetical protein